jgi:hypothetical protein
MIGNILKSQCLIFAFVAFMGTIGSAQTKNSEVGLLLGGSIVPTSNTGVKINSGLIYQDTYAHKFTANGSIGFGFEITFVALPSQDVQSNSRVSPRNYASIFVTPGIRVTFLSNSAISPWGSVGGGYARFDESTTLISGAPNTFKTGTSKEALQYGGGVDFKTPFKILSPLVLRGEPA